MNREASPTLSPVPGVDLAAAAQRREDNLAFLRNREVHGARAAVAQLVTA